MGRRFSPGAARPQRHAYGVVGTGGDDGDGDGGRATWAWRPAAIALKLTLTLTGLLAALLMFPMEALAQARAGEVEFLRGVVVAQLPGEPPRSLAIGAALREGEQLQSAPASSAMLRLDDGTRLTLRPDSRLVLRTWRYKAPLPGEEPTSDNTLVLDLLRGGLRAVTGLVARSGPDAARIQTPVAAIGIRGTDFQARLCQGDGDCAPPAPGRQVSANAALATSARVLQLEGRAEAIDLLERRRRLVPGASVYPGDRVATAAASHLVLAFRDTSRLTLGPASELRIDDYRYDPDAPQEGRMLMSVLRGTLRALTGLIARADPRHVTFTTPTATLGIRGTGFDLACLGACAEGQRAPSEDDWLRVCTWRGAVDLRPPDSEVVEPVEEGHCAALGLGAVQALPGPLPVQGPRPDSLEVPEAFFSQASLPPQFKGLWVYVEVGGVRLYGPNGFRDLGNGEGGFADETQVQRLADAAALIDPISADIPSRPTTFGPPPICTR